MLQYRPFIAFIICFLSINTVESALWQKNPQIVEKVSDEKKQFVADTSQRVCAGRAFSSQQRDFSYSDPVSELFAGDKFTERIKWLRQFADKSDPNVTFPVVLRAVTIDDMVKKIITDSSIKQIVTIGAGMCTRPYRLNLPGISWFEVDMERVISLKQKLLRWSPFKYWFCLFEKRNISLKYISIDLAENLHLLISQLKSSGFDSNSSTLFIMEGLCYYLTDDEVKALFAALPRINGSRVIASHVTGTSGTSVRTEKKIMTEKKTIANLFKCDLNSNKVHKSFGKWKITSFCYPSKLQRVVRNWRAQSLNENPPNDEAEAFVELTPNA